MRIQDFPQGQPAEWCHNDCHTHAPEGGWTRTATHVAWILDRKTYLCATCARGWREAWEGAL